MKKLRLSALSQFSFVFDEKLLETLVIQEPLTAEELQSLYKVLEKLCRCVDTETIEVKLLEVYALVFCLDKALMQLSTNYEEGCTLAGVSTRALLVLDELFNMHAYAKR